MQRRSEVAGPPRPAIAAAMLAAASATVYFGYWESALISGLTAACLLAEILRPGVRLV